MSLHLFDFLTKKHKLSEEKTSEQRTSFFTPGILIAACFLLYTSMMAAKGVFLAEITYLMKVFSVDKYTASLTNTYYFVAYAGVQVLLFFFIKKINIRKFLIITVPISAVATMLMGRADGIEDMYLLFALCGVFQAGVYAGCNHTLTSCLPSEWLTKANSVMNFGYATGTVVSYAFCALCVKMELWSVPFFVMGAILFAAVVFYYICAKGCARRFGKESTDKKRVESCDSDAFIKVGRGRKKAFFYAIDLVTTFLATSLYYAIMNWISTLLVKVYGQPDHIAIYITILAPMLIAIGPMMTIRACDKEKDFIKVGAIFMLVALPLPLLLSFVYDSVLLVAFVISAAFVVLINGVKAISLSVMAFKLRNEVNTAEYSVIVNATASLAGGIAPTVAGKIIDNGGWSAYYLAIFAVCLAVTLTLLITDALVRKRKVKENNAL